jgi:hypothetical protein
MGRTGFRAPGLAVQKGEIPKGGLVKKAKKKAKKKKR